MYQVLAWGGIDLNSGYYPVNGGYIDYYLSKALTLKKGDILIISNNTGDSIPDLGWNYRNDNSLLPIRWSINAKYRSNNQYAGPFDKPQYISLSKLLPVLSSLNFSDFAYNIEAYYVIEDSSKTLSITSSAQWDLFNFIQLRQMASNYIGNSYITVPKDNHKEILRVNNNELIVFYMYQNKVPNISTFYTDGTHVTPAATSSNQTLFGAYDPTIDAITLSKTQGVRVISAPTVIEFINSDAGTDAIIRYKRYQLPTS